MSERFSKYLLAQVSLLVSKSCAGIFRLPCSELDHIRGEVLEFAHCKYFSFEMVAMKHESIGTCVGQTRTGRQIFMCSIAVSIHSRNLDFSLREVFDAYCVFEYLALREKRKNGNKTEDYLRFENHAALYASIIRESKAVEECVRDAGITGAFSIRDHGRRLINIEFRDFID